MDDARIVAVADFGGRLLRAIQKALRGPSCRTVAGPRAGRSISATTSREQLCHLSSCLRPARKRS
eukprot:14573267-Alexandrium_andersonii.AAC.1